jgi:glycosyltransferase involved in cell wall biosynthesis
MQKTCIVIPCYNEADRFEEASFLSYAAARPYINFLFVDDGSTDSTADLLRRLKQKNEEQFNFITRKENLGKAVSVREGVLKSIEWKNFEFIGYLDADLATPLTEIEWLLQHFEQTPGLVMVFGSRKKTGTNSIHRNILRHLMGRVYAAFLTQTLRLDIYDTQCGAKLFRASQAEILFRHPFIDRWLFDVELLCRLKNAYGKNTKAMFREVTLREWIEKGHSRIRIIDLLLLPVQTTRIFFRYL